MSSEGKNFSENKKETSEKNISSNPYYNKRKRIQDLENQLYEAVKEKETKLFEERKNMKKKLCEKKEEKEKEFKEIMYLEKLIDRMSKEIESLKKELYEKRKNIKVKEEEIQKLKEEFESTMKSLEEKTWEEIKALEKEFYDKIQKIEDEKSEINAGPPGSKKNYNCEETFSICIISTNSTEVRMICSLDDKISDIIERYKSKFNYQENTKIFFLFKNQILESNETVSESELYPNCIIEVIIKDS